MYLSMHVYKSVGNARPTKSMLLGVGRAPPTLGDSLSCLNVEDIKNNSNKPYLRCAPIAMVGNAHPTGLFIILGNGHRARGILAVLNR